MLSLASLRMGQPDAAEKPIIEAVILDLDGTLIDTGTRSLVLSCEASWPGFRLAGCLLLGL